jgi:hypothetical protein
MSWGRSEFRQPRLEESAGTLRRGQGIEPIVTGLDEIGNCRFEFMQAGAAFPARFQVFTNLGGAPPGELAVGRE